MRTSFFQSAFSFAIPLLLAVLAVAAPNRVQAGETDLAFGTVARDLRYVAGWPLGLDRRDLMGLTSCAAFAGGLYASKREINEGVQALLDSDGEETGGSLRGFKFLGDHGVVAGTGALFIVAGLEIDSPREVETGVMLLESYAFTGLFTVSSQFILAEERPSEGGGMRFFKADGHGVSGHSALAACLVGPLSHQYLRRDEGDGNLMAVGKELARITLWTLPFLTGISRIESNEHYAWNVLLGLSIGYGTGVLVARSHEIARHEAGESAPCLQEACERNERRIVWNATGISCLF